MSGGAKSTGGIFQKIVTVVLLFGLAVGLRALYEPEVTALNPASMATLGFIILAAYTTADLAERVHLPHITGYLLTGLACGPHFLGLVTEGVVEDLRLFNALAVALIALAAGSALSLDMLRKGGKVVAAVLFSQFAILVPAITGLLMLMGGAIPGFSVPFLGALDTTTTLAIAVVLGVVASAQSPAASIAIIEDTKAKGPVSDAVLGVSVLNNVVVVVLFAVGLALAGALAPDLIHHAGGEHEQTSLALGLLREVGGAGVLGVTLGFAIAAYIRWVNQELLMVVAALSFTVTWAAGELGVNEVLAFLAAGFVVRNYTAAHGELSKAVSTLSLPVYVIFFFIAGAGIHVDALKEMWQFALILFGVRMLSLFAGTSIGVKLSDGPKALSRVGWMGFGAQAGIALSMAIEVGHGFEGVGLDMETLAVAGIALNEMFGPVLLQISLGLAGELPKEEDTHVEEFPEEDPSEIGDESALPRWISERGHEDFDPWGPPPEVDDRTVTRVARGVRADLQVLVRDLRSGPVGDRREAAHHYLGLLRREFLRFHQATLSFARRDDLSGSERTAAVWRAQSQLARRWENLILDRAATVDFRADADAVEDLIATVDRLVAQLDAGGVDVAITPAQLAPNPEDSTLRRLTRARLRITSSLRRKPLTRRVDPSGLARFYLSGHVPTNLHPVAGLQALTERHLVSRARALFEVNERVLEEVLADPVFINGSALERCARMEGMRDELESEFILAHEEIDRLADETVRATAAGLGRAYKGLVNALEQSGTPDLPQRLTRFSRVYDQRQVDQALLLTRLRDSRELTRGVASGLAMELELVRLRNVLNLALVERVDALRRELNGRVVLQLSRTEEAAAAALADLSTHVNEDADAGLLSDAVRDAISPLSRVIEEGLGMAEPLRNNLKTEAVLEPLRHQLDLGIDELTDRFVVSGVSPKRLKGRGLPPPPDNRELDFRAAVRRFLEIEVSRDLTELTVTLLTPVEEAIRGLEALKRGITFNTELSLTELDITTQDDLDEGTRALVRDSLINALARSGGDLKQLHEGAEAAVVAVAEQLPAAVLSHLDDLNGYLVEGRWGELRLRVTQGQLQRRRQLLTGDLSSLMDLRAQWTRLTHRTLGEDNARKALDWLGLPDPADEAALGPHAFIAPAERVEFPVAFRRLFADTSLEAGDLLTGREREVEKVRRVLLGEEPGSSRAVAVVGAGGVGQSAVMNALVRGLSDRMKVVRHELKAPVETPEEVDALLIRTEGAVIILEGLHWLFGIYPGGFQPLRRFLHGVLEDRGRNAWLVSTQLPVWEYADRVVPLSDVFPEQVHLHTLEPDELRRAVLARHRLSGFDVRFTRGDGHPMLWIKEVLTPESREEAIYEGYYFQRLHEVTGGVLSDALRLWMASIVAMDPSTETMVVGEVPRTPLKSMRRLPDQALLTLRQVSRQGRLTVREHALQFRMDVEESEALLSRLVHWGLLVQHDETLYTASPWLLGTMDRALRERRLEG